MPSGNGTGNEQQVHWPPLKHDSPQRLLPHAAPTTDASSAGMQAWQQPRGASQCQTTKMRLGSETEKPHTRPCPGQLKRLCSAAGTCDRALAQSPCGQEHCDDGTDLSAAALSLCLPQSLLHPLMRRGAARCVAGCRAQPRCSTVCKGSTANIGCTEPSK